MKLPDYQGAMLPLRWVWQQLLSELWWFDVSKIIWRGVCQTQSQPQLCSEVLYRKEKEREKGGKEEGEQRGSKNKVYHKLFLALTTGSLSMGNDEETKYSN